MHVDVIISTYDRLEPLKRCIRSITAGDYKDISIFVVVDGNKPLFNKLLGEPVNMIFNEKRMDYVFSMNRVLGEMEQTNTVLYGSDDLIFWPSCISNAVKAMKEHFPDTDGLVALKQIQKEGGAAFGLMGRTFINRFPDSAVFCPEFIHYGADTELKRFAISIDKLYQCREALVDHPRLEDRTTELSLEVKVRDKQIYKKRKNRGLLWGHTFERIG